jgi:hypothetical protein
MHFSQFCSARHTAWWWGHRASWRQIHCFGRLHFQKELCQSDGVEVREDFNSCSGIRIQPPLDSGTKGPQQHDLFTCNLSGKPNDSIQLLSLLYRTVHVEKLRCDQQCSMSAWKSVDILCKCNLFPSIYVMSVIVCSFISKVINVKWKDEWN